ncbi:hypothetical protein [Streptomyces hawaiiensis]|uniref:hypothetical protein n=1 Tax=Streptomyces hawaiiensis TaxID=67305 RepID=UPI00365C6C00
MTKDIEAPPPGGRRDRCGVRPVSRDRTTGPPRKSPCPSPAAPSWKPPPARFGWRRAYGHTTQADALLTEHSETAYTEAADHAQLATAKNTDVLTVQPCALDVRGRVLYLEGILTGARNHGLPPELIERLEDVVDHGHELTVLLADAVRTTADHATGQ